MVGNSNGQFQYSKTNSMELASPQGVDYSYSFPRVNGSTDVDDANISVRFKHGIHTIYLFIDALAPFSNAATELLNVLIERYPDGLTRSFGSPEKTTFDADSTLAFGALKAPNDPSSGWVKLKTGDGEKTPTALGLKNNSLLAFAVLAEEEDEPEFEVEWPKEDEELYEE
ncbi:hypothetical protein LZL87_006153 [Fusarium oxysporum]|nr:hypothetical protein LZL87_006153 [Fusarium oxysporum]